MRVGRGDKKNIRREREREKMIIETKSHELD